MISRSDSSCGDLCGSSALRSSLSTFQGLLYCICLHALGEHKLQQSCNMAILFYMYLLYHNPVDKQIGTPISYSIVCLKGWNSEPMVYFFILYNSVVFNINFSLFFIFVSKSQSDCPQHHYNLEDSLIPLDHSPHHLLQDENVDYQ